MRPQRPFTLGVLALACLSGSASAQYYPYNPYAYYPRPAYPAYANPYYAAPVYYPSSPTTVNYPPATPVARPLPQVPATPAAQPEPIVIIPERTAPADPPRSVDVPWSAPTSLPAADTVSRPRGHHPASPVVGVVDDSHPCGDGPACSRSWFSGCDRCRDDLHRFYFEAGAVYLQPRWRDNTAFVTSTTAAGQTVQGFHDFAYDWAVTPRAEVGFQCAGGWGMRLRYMYYSQNDEQSLTGAAGTDLFTANPLGLSDRVAAGNRANAASALLFHLADFEGQQEFRWGCWSLRGSGGGRYANLQQRYDYTETSAAGATVSTLNSFSQFHGGGPTAALELRRLFPRAHLSFYSITRGSVLLGRYEQRAAAGTTQVAFTEEGVLPIGEVETGVEFWCQIHRCRLFLAAGAMGQVWFGAGNSSDSSPTFPELNSRSARDLSFLGLTLTVGIQF